MSTRERSPQVHGRLRRSDLRREERRQELAERRERKDRLLAAEGRQAVRRGESPAETFYRHRVLTWLIAALMGAAPAAAALALTGAPSYLVAAAAAAVGIAVFVFFLIASWLTRRTVVPELGQDRDGEESRDEKGHGRAERVLNWLDAVIEAAFSSWP